MLHLSLEKGVFHAPPPRNSQVINQDHHSNAVLLNLTIKETAYIPYPGCVFKHILNTSSLTHNEKLFYLIADALSLINGKSNTKQRSVALPSIKWAKKLNCSKTAIFSMQNSLEEKGYFVIIRDTNKFGKNQRNIIIPTLPDQVFQQLCTEHDRYDLDPKDKNLIPSPKYLSTLTSLSKSPSSDSQDIQASKRTYLDKTKLFIKINYQILHLITSSEQLSPFAKILWLYFYSKCYKNYLKSKQFNTDQHSNDYFAYTSSYLELETLFACSKAQLSKAINSLEKFAYINRSRFHVKNNNENDNLHDKSLWTIIASLPQEYHQQITQFKPRLSLEKKRAISICDPYISNSGQYINKNLRLNKSIKDSDSIDANHNFCETPQSELSVFYNNSTQEKEANDLLSQQTNTIDFISIDNNVKINQIAKGVQANKSTSASKKPIELKDQEKTPRIQENTTTEANKNPNAKLECKTAQMKLTNTVKFSPNATLKGWYPLSSEDIDKLNSKSGREFSNNFVNELLLKLDYKYPDRTFLTKNHVLSYMAKALSRELHQAPLVNHDTFRFSKNNEESLQKSKREKYLSEVESSVDTSYAAQFKRKIAATLEPKLAYQLLTKAKFATTVQDQHFGHGYCDNKFDDQCSKTESTVITTDTEVLSDEDLNNQQPDIMQNTQDYSFTVTLSQETVLSDLQRQTLENSITAVYGSVDISYQQLQDNHKKSDKSQPRQEHEIDLEELDHTSAWYKIRKELKNHLGDFIDKAWFSKLTAKENLKNKTLTLLAPSNFMRDWIKNKYGHVIEKIAGKLNYQVVELTTKKYMEFAA